MYAGIFDTHAHYDDECFDTDRAAVLSSLPEKGITGVVNCATQLKSCEAGKNLAEEYSFVYFAVGIHPQECNSADKTYTEELRKYLTHEKCVAIGEIGLDYHYDLIPKQRQREIFEEQLIIAKEAGMPVIIHDREAHGDTWEMLKKYRPYGVLHCFSGSAESARDITGLGMYLGFGGAVTFKNAKKSVQAVQSIPLERLLLETDCPYMTPAPHRGRRNDSSYIAFTAEFIADLRGISTQELIDITAENARRIFFKK